MIKTIHTPYDIVESIRTVSGEGVEYIHIVLVSGDSKFLYIDAIISLTELLEMTRQFPKSTL